MNDDTDQQQSRHQRSKGSASTGSDRRRSRSISAGQGMCSLGDTLSKAIENMTGSMSEAVLQARQQKGPKLTIAAAPAPAAPATPSTDIRAAAIEAIESNEGLSDHELAQACNIIRKNPDIGSSYLSLSRPGARTSFLQIHMDDLRMNRHIFDGQSE